MIVLKQSNQKQTCVSQYKIHFKNSITLIIYKEEYTTYLASAEKEWLKDFDPRKSNVCVKTSILTGLYEGSSPEIMRMFVNRSFIEDKSR